MPPDPRLRAGDRDRDAVAEQLREAHAEGRLTLDELEDRLGKAYAARTFAELAPLTADLPPRPFSAGTVARRPSSPQARPPTVRGAGASGRWVDAGLRASWYAWAAVVSINVLIWLFVSIGTGDWIYFWPAWVAGPWGVVLVVGTLSRRAEVARRQLPPGGSARNGR